MWRRWCDGDDDDDGFGLRSRRSMEVISVGLFKGRWDFIVVRLLFTIAFLYFLSLFLWIPKLKLSKDVRFGVVWCSVVLILLCLYIHLSLVHLG